MWSILDAIFELDFETARNIQRSLLEQQVDKVGFTNTRR